MTEVQATLGDDYDPLGRHLADPYPFYARAQRETPIFYSSKLGVWVVTRLAEAKKVLRDGQTFSSANVLRPLAPLSMEVLPILFGGYPPVPVFVVMDGEQHKQQRQPWATGFGPDRVEAVKHYLTDRATALAEKLSTGTSADLMADYANPLTVSVICHMLGFAPKDHDALGDDTRKAATLAMGHAFLSDDEQVEAAQAWVRSQQLIGRYVSERRAEPRGDLISEAISGYAPHDEELSEDEEAELVGAIFGVTLAGHITPASMLGDGVRQLLEHPKQWQLLCDWPGLIPNAVDEIARFCTPEHIFLRQTTKDTTIAGQELPAGTEVAVWLAAANRDGSAFDQPDKFDITRPRRTGHIAFGHGPHFCIGAALGRLEVEISLRVLTERLPKLRLVPDQPAISRPSLAHRGPITVPVTW
jgi:cytochrome P450